MRLELIVPDPLLIMTWGKQVEARHRKAKAIVAVARRLAVTLHRMWITSTDLRRQAVSA